VQEVKVGFREVITVPANVLTSAAFAVMHSKAVSGIGIIEDGKLVGVLSASDIRHVGYAENMFERFNNTVKEFASLVHSLRPEIPAVVVITPSATLIEIADMFLKYKVHRIFIVNSKEDMKPIGVISLHDFLLLFGMHL